MTIGTSTSSLIKYMAKKECIICRRYFDERNAFLLLINSDSCSTFVKPGIVEWQNIALMSNGFLMKSPFCGLLEKVLGYLSNQTEMYGLAFLPLLL